MSNKTNVTTNSWTTTANSSGAWSVTVPALVAADTYSATVTAANGCNTASVASPTATVVPVTSTCPTISNTPVTNTPYTDTSTIVYGTVNVTTTGSIVRLYVDGALAGSQTLNTTGSQNWAITSSLPFYNGAVLKASFQSGSGSSEKTDCGTSTVVCNSPGTPSISPTSTTIYTGQNVTYTVSNVVSNTWYAVQDNSGTSYATSVYTTSGSGFSLNTSNFNTPGTYSLSVSANMLTGCPASTASAAVTVNTMVTPVRFVTVGARKVNQGIAVSWSVADETEVNHYEVEKSFDGINFGVVGSVNYNTAITATNRYDFTDITVNNADKLYYRIRQVDNNQYYMLSSIVMVKTHADKVLQVWPNPATNQVNVNITASTSESTSVDLFDLTGNKLLSKSVLLAPGVNSILVKGLNRIAPGVYLLKVYVEGQNNFKKITISH